MALHLWFVLGLMSIFTTFVRTKSTPKNFQLGTIVLLLVFASGSFAQDYLKMEGSKIFNFKQESSLKVSFQAGRIPGSYIILFRGISSDGDLVHGLNHFNVE